MLRTFVLSCVIAIANPWTYVRANDPGIDFFESKIRPVLVEHCYKCHSHQSKMTKNGLALDSATGWRNGGDSGPAIVPTKPSESLLVKAIRYGDESLQMPPAGKLPDAVIADIEKWIAMGAPDPRTTVIGTAMTAEQAKKWWAFQPMSHSSLGGSLSVNGMRIDELIKTKLTDKQLSRNPPTDPRTLVRRIYLDLWGLPPTPYQVNEFVESASRNRLSTVEKLIDHLMSSPHFGERWGRHWLDVARFAESSGYEHDNPRHNAYQYRDFVIEAFRRDLPFDKFVQWQIAGDELAPDEPMALKATGFLAAGLMNGQVTEREALKERYEVFDDWIGTTGTAFLGLTVGCARCHDHKFDAIATKEYYRLAANFTSAVRNNMNVPRDVTDFRRGSAVHERQIEELAEQCRRFEKSALPLAKSWRAKSPEPPAPPWLTITADEFKSGKTFRGLETDLDLTQQPDGSYLFTRINSDVGPMSFTISSTLEKIAYIRLEALTDESLPNFGPGFGEHGDFRVNVSMKVAPTGDGAKAKSIKMEKIKATTGDKPGGVSWTVNSKHSGHDQAVVFKLLEPIGTADGAKLTITLQCPPDTDSGRLTIGRFRIGIAAIDSDPDPLGPQMAHDEYVQGLSDFVDDKLTPALVRLFCLTNAEWQQLDLAARDAQRNWKRPPYDVSFGVTEGVIPYRMKIQGPDLYDLTHVLKRGDPNKPDVVAEPGVLSFLVRGDLSRWYKPPPTGSRTSHRRAALARWLTDVENGAGALTARVIVNRLWQHHFGRGLVNTPSDFGAQGDKPTHPELIEYLASELIRSGWSLKHVHRLILTSATYQQSSDANKAGQQVDPESTLLWRYPPHRLEAEAIRDCLLAVSGRLDPKPMGPGSLDEKMTRRSVYFTVKRSKLIPALVQLDWPEALSGVGKRTTTTVPTQALWMLNNPQVRECAAALAAKLEGKSDNEAISIAYELCVSRPPTSSERDAALGFLKSGNGDSRTDFVHTLFMLQEFVTIR